MLYLPVLPLCSRTLFVAVLLWRLSTVAPLRCLCWPASSPQRESSEQRDSRNGYTGSEQTCRRAFPPKSVFGCTRECSSLFNSCFAVCVLLRILIHPPSPPHIHLNNTHMHVQIRQHAFNISTGQKHCWEMATSSQVCKLWEPLTLLETFHKEFPKLSHFAVCSKQVARTYVVVWRWFTAQVAIFNESFECYRFSPYPSSFVAIQGLCRREA